MNYRAHELLAILAADSDQRTSTNLVRIVSPYAIYSRLLVNVFELKVQIALALRH